MRKYYVFYGTFENQYSIYYTENNKEEMAIEEKGAERITRKEAIKLCVAERYQRKVDQAFSGYADIYIYPFSLYENKGEIDIYNDRRITIDGYFIKKNVRGDLDG